MGGLFRDIGMTGADGRRHRRGRWSSSPRPGRGIVAGRASQANTAERPCGRCGALLPGAGREPYQLTSRASAAMPCRRVGFFRALLDHAGIDTTLVGTEPDRTIGLYTNRDVPRVERRFSYWRGHRRPRRLADDPARGRAVLAQGRSGLI